MTAKTLFLSTLLLGILLFIPSVINLSLAFSPGDGAKDHAPQDIQTLPVFGFSDFSISSSDKTLISNAKTKSFTEQGVLDVKAKLSSPEDDVRIYNNGIEFPTSINGQDVSGKVVLSPGKNHIAMIIYHSGIRYSRTVCGLIETNIRPAVLRFELTWSGQGDLDLHVDDGKGKYHCSYSNKDLNIDNWNIQLDVDNTVRKGPENIRVYMAPAYSTIRCYVNYYGGNTSQEVTVRLYQNSNLTAVYTHTFSAKEAGGGNKLTDKSWLVDEFKW